MLSVGLFYYYINLWEPNIINSVEIRDDIACNFAGYKHPFRRKKTEGRKKLVFYRMEARIHRGDSFIANIKLTPDSSTQRDSSAGLNYFITGSLWKGLRTQDPLVMWSCHLSTKILQPCTVSHTYMNGHGPVWLYLLKTFLYRAKTPCSNANEGQAFFVHGTHGTQNFFAFSA